MAMLLFAVSCSSGGATATRITSAATSAPEPTAVPTTAPATVAAPATAVPTPTAISVGAAFTAPAVDPTSTPTPVPTAVPTTADVESAPTAAPVATVAPTPVGSQEVLVANGAEVHTLNCARCHAENGLGAQYSGLIGVGNKYSTQGMIDELTTGHPVTFGFADRLSADEIASVVAYVKATFP